MARRQLFLACIVAFVFAHTCQAQTINISLNLHYNDSANPALGGSWTLVAKTDGVNGIAAIDALMSNINTAGVAYQSGIGAVLDSGGPFVGTIGGAIDVVYFQDLSTPADVVTNVGRGSGTPGNLPFDPLNDPAWNNAARIATGTFGATRPDFTSVGSQSTDGNVLSSSSEPFSVSDAAVTVIVRDAIVGDYNLNGTVDAADYVVWRKTLGAVGPGLLADGNGNNSVDPNDYDVWQRGFALGGGAVGGSGSGAGDGAAVPEPATAISVTLILATVILCGRWRRAAVNRITAATLSLTLAVFATQSAQALPRTWIGGNVDWTDGGSTANWTPADEPDFDDEAIFNSANTVNLGSNNSIVALTMSGSIDLNTNGFDLDVNGLVQLVDATTNLFVGRSTSLLTADSITINNGADVELNGGTIQINEEAGNGLLDINAGGELVGHGTLSMTDSVAAVTTLIINDGAITARRDPLVIFGAPQVGTLSLNQTDVQTHIDLDGVSETGDVNVLRNQTLDVNMVLADAFNGVMLLTQNATIEMFNAWNLGVGGIINADNGFIPGVFPNPDVPAGTSTIAGPTLSVSGGTINVVDTDGTLQFDAPFLMNTGTFNNEGHTIFNNAAVINAGGTFTMGASGSDLTVGTNAIVTFHQPSFNLDGTAAGTVITVNEGGVLTFDLGDYDNDAATNAFDATITLNDGIVDITTSDAEFIMDGTLNMNSSAPGHAGWDGEPVDIGNDAGALDADLNATGNGGSQFAAQVDFRSDADVNVAAGARLVFLTAATVNFDTVNGANNAEFTGSGEIEFNGTVNVNEAVTLNMVGGTVNLDGSDDTGETINIDAPLVINAANIESFGRMNTIGGANILDINNNVGTGILTVNLDDPNDEWTLNAPGMMNLVNDNTESTLLAGSDANLNGTVNVTGDVRTTARVDIGSTALVNILTAAQPLRLSGGDDVDDPNTINGGTITGVGILGADTGKELIGFGTINTQIDFDGSAGFYADNGTLTILGTILDAGQIGTADADGTLHVTNAWNNNVTAGVQLHGGIVSGGTMTNDAVAGISGHGLVTARVINNTQLFASLGETLIFETPGNDNDWDGTTNTGEIEAASVTGTDIELRDVGAAFGFTGTVRATTNNTVFANGFALDFNPGSTLSLASGGTYRSTSSTDIGGTVTVGAGSATIEVENNFVLTFETGSTTTLGSNLQLKNNKINIEAGATFSGAGGAIVIPDGSNLVADNLANIGVLLDMQGGFRPGNSEGIARVDLFDFQLSNTSELFVELTGTSLNAFDRLVASGDAVIDGYLNIDIDGAFVPSLGQTFNIITANAVTGAFDYADVSGMPAGLAFHIEYLSNAVQLQVVTEPFFSADFDEDGDVDKTDLAIWRGAFDLNQLGDADGDNDSDGADLLIWQRQFGSHPGAGAGSESAVPEPTSLVLLLLACVIARAAARVR